MSETRVASRYAKSLLDLSKEQKLVEEIFHDMHMLDEICEGSRDFKLFLRSPIIKHHRKQQILVTIFKGRVNALTLGFLRLAASKGRANILQSISQEYQRQYLRYAGIQKAEVVTTFKLNDKLRNSFKLMVRELSSMEPDLSEVVSEDILGGYVLTIDDQMIDSSLKSGLKRIELELK